MEKISWRDKITNDDVLKRVNEERSLLNVARLHESSNRYRAYKCEYWCQCKSGVSGLVLL